MLTALRSSSGVIHPDVSSCPIVHVGDWSVVAIILSGDSGAGGGDTGSSRITDTSGHVRELSSDAGHERWQRWRCHLMIGDEGSGDGGDKRDGSGDMSEITGSGE